MSPPLIFGITGASGAVYAWRLLQVLRAAGREVHLSISESGRELLRQELGLAIDLLNFDAADLWPEARDLPAESPLAYWQGLWKDEAAERQAAGLGRIVYHHFQDFLAPIASGSFLTGGMVICPCSGGTLSAVAHGSSQNLICRAADVQLKERRKLILVPRETPLSLIQLDNLRRCAEAGAVVLPAMPGFYHGVRHAGDLVDFVVARICDQLGVEQQLMKRWGE